MKARLSLILLSISTALLFLAVASLVIKTERLQAEKNILLAIVNKPPPPAPLPPPVVPQVVKKGAPYGAKAAARFADAERLNCADFTLPGSAVIMVAGQSNAANYVQTPGINQHGVLIGNYYGGQCVEAVDPLMGADGNLGSPWIRLSNELIAQGKFKRVLLVPVALGGTSIARWKAGGDLHMVMTDILIELAQKSMPPTHFLWVQGEADRKSGSRYLMNGGVDYLDALQSLLNTVNYHSKARIYLAQATRCSEKEKPSKRLLWALAQLAMTRTDTFPGPNLDYMVSRLDRSGCHFTDAGAKRLTAAWMKALQ